MKDQDNGHPQHPIRNFGYIFLCLFFALGFALLFLGVGLSRIWGEGLGIALSCLGGGISLLGVYVGILRPAQKAKRYRDYQNRHR